MSIHVHTHDCTHVHTCVHAHADAYVYTHVYTQDYKHIETLVHAHACTHVHTQVLEQDERARFELEQTIAITRGLEDQAGHNYFTPIST